MKVVANRSANLADLQTSFADFRERHQLSYNQFAKICGDHRTGMSRSTLERLINRGVQPAYLEKNKTVIVEYVIAYLESKQFNSQQIQNEISSLFGEEVIEDMVPTRTELDRSTCKFFGLKHDAFALFPRSNEEVFTSKELDKTFEKIEDAVRYQGFTAVVGEIGSGKTVLKTRLADLADEAEDLKLIWPAFFDMGEINSGSIVVEVLRAFDQKVPLHKVDRKRALVNTLKKANDDGISVAIVIDEAHRLNDRVMSALKNFYEMLGVKWRKFIGIVMFGQPTLQGRLREVQFQEIAERLQIVKMPSLGKQAEGYLAHRLQLAGGDLRNLFDDASIEAFIENARAKKNPATPLQLGNLVNQALLAAFERGEKRVTADLLISVIPGLFASDEPKLRSTSTTKLAAVK